MKNDTIKKTVLLLTLLFFPILSAEHSVHINQVGYERTLPKSAVVTIPTTETAPTSYSVINTDDQSVAFTATIAASDWETMSWYNDRKFARIDFSQLKDSGSFNIELTSVGTWSSYTFKIEDDLLLKETFSMVLNYFKQSRNSGEVWQQDQNVPVYSDSWTSQRIDASGGWYDASGDISKYLSHLQYANFMSPQQTPFVIWQMAHIKDDYSNLTDRINQTTALEEEVAFGADFLVRMKSTNSFFYTTVFDGWSGELDQRTVCSYSGSAGDLSEDYQAAFREGGGMAIAALAACARLNISGTFTSAQYLTAAEEAYAHLKTNNTSYCDNGIENIIDDYCALMAATELYKATNTTSYLTDAQTRAASIIARQHSEGWFYADGGTRPYYHAVEAGLPAIALILYAELDSLTDQVATLAAIDDYSNHTVSITESQNPFGMARQLFKYQGTNRTNFFIPQTNETGYWWQGEDARLASLAVMGLKGKSTSTTPDDMVQLAVDQLDWILGKNPYDFCMLQGAGSQNPPSYGYTKYGHTDLDGGISNGIHSATDGGEGIDFIIDDGSQDTVYIETWRSSEQWIPHAAWYMLAVAALSHEQDSIPSPAWSQQQREISLAIEGPVTVKVFTLSGRMIKEFDASSLGAVNTQFSQKDLAAGVYYLKIRGMNQTVEITRKILR